MTIEHDEPITIPLDDLVRIFQLNDPSLYQKPNENEHEIHLSNSFLAMNAMGSIIPHEVSQSNAQENDLKVLLAPTGMTITVRTFYSNEADGNQLDFVSITISQFIDMGEDHTPQEDRYALNPVFTLTGKMNDDCVIVVKEAIASMPSDLDKPRFIDATNNKNFMSIMLYADACFRAALEARTITLPELEKYVTDEAIEKAEKPFNLICDRTRFDTIQIRNHLPLNPYYFMIPLTDFENIFQLQNEHIYSRTEPDDYKELQQNITTFLRRVESAYTPHFEEGVEFTNPPIFIENDNGESVWSFPYIYEDSFGVLRNYHILIVGGAENSEPDSDEKFVRPLAIIIGAINQNMEYEPLEATCLAQIEGDEKNPEGEYHTVHTPDGFLGTLCYAEGAMVSILTQNALETKLLSRWLMTVNSSQAIDRFNHISHRSSDELTAEILQLTSQPNATETFAPSSAQDLTRVPRGYHLN